MGAAMGLAAHGHAQLDAATGAYRRHRPDETVLYRCVEAHWEEFRERAEEAGGLPKFVLREFEDYLRCGRLEHGLLRCACRSCGHEMLVAMSCKRRQHRLHERADGTLLLTLKSAWRDGTRAIVLEPDTLLARLCAAVPPPRFHMLRCPLIERPRASRETRAGTGALFIAPWGRKRGPTGSGATGEA
jgi:hypothetical protein